MPSGKAEWLFGAREAPFLLLALVAVLAWAVTHTVSRSLESPLLELARSVSHPKEPQDLLSCESGAPETIEADYIVELQLTNLSSAKRLDGVSLLVQPRGASAATIVGVRLKAVPPAMAGKKKEECDSRGALLPPTTFRPSDEFFFEIGVVGAEDDLIVQVVSSKGSVLLKERNLATRLIGHEAEVVFVLAILAAMCVALYLGFYWSWSAKP